MLNGGSEETKDGEENVEGLLGGGLRSIRWKGRKMEHEDLRKQRMGKGGSCKWEKREGKR